MRKMSIQISIVTILFIASLFFLHSYLQSRQNVSTEGMSQTTVENLISQHAIPDPTISPGMALPDVTAEMVSKPGYATSVRNVPESEKRRVYAEYGIASHQSGEYEIDHIISLELGGSNDIRNLFPQSYHGAWNAHMKDKLENKLHEMVVHHEITLQQAQYDISHNWTIAYKRLVVSGEDVKVTE